MPNLLRVVLLLALCHGVGAIADGPLPPAADSRWYDTQRIGISFVDQKSTLSIDAETAVRIIDASDDRIADDWQSHLPAKITPAAQVRHLPDEDGITTHVEDRQPLRVHIVGFDERHVRIVLARHVGNHLWHWFHSVEADLTLERSPQVDRLLDLDAFAAPFTRSFRGVKYGDSRQTVHELLGPPDASRFTQAQALSWDYYFDENITIEYKWAVFKILNEVPAAVRDRTTDNPHVRYNQPE